MEEKNSSARTEAMIPLSGLDLINQPLLNKGTAFTESERDAFDLHGLLPPHVGTLEQQVERRLKALRAIGSDFQKYAFLRELQDSNETLFYSLLVRNIEELLPLVYTPTVGEGCQRFSEIWRKPRGLFLSYPNRNRLRSILANKHLDKVKVIVVSDGERILGLGDQGAGGMGIPIGKLSLYTACAGIHPEETLPILLDVGTDNKERLADPLYIGWRHERVRGVDYDVFVDEFVAAVKERWPNVLLQWEDFAGVNAARFLQKYRHQLCTFNDDIQGTAAVATASLLAAINVTGIPLAEQRIVLVGAGSAGSGIASLLLKVMIDAGAHPQQARQRFFMLDWRGLLVEGMDVTEAQRPFVQDRERVANWKLERSGEIGLLDVVGNARPTVLIGTSGKAGLFTEAVLRSVAANVQRPVVFPLSNPTANSEATPQQIVEWTDGRALIGTGSPFPPLDWKGRAIPLNQTNNSYIFPGIGLGVIAAGARHVSDEMLMAASKALADLSPNLREGDGRLLPPVTDLRAVAVSIARAVARVAINDGLAPPCDDAALESKIHGEVWQPVYRCYLVS